MSIQYSQFSRLTLVYYRSISQSQSYMLCRQRSHTGGPICHIYIGYIPAKWHTRSVLKRSCQQCDRLQYSRARNLAHKKHTAACRVQQDEDLAWVNSRAAHARYAHVFTAWATERGRHLESLPIPQDSLCKAPPPRIPTSPVLIDRSW